MHGRREACPQRAAPCRVIAASLLALLVAAGQGYAEPTPGEAAPREWIRPEEVPTRADVLLRQLEDARPEPAALSSLEEIEKALPQIGRDLDPILHRATDAIERSAAPADLEDIQRELQGAAAPLAAWKNTLAAEAKRVADLLDVVTGGERSWSETRARPETAAAGDVVVRRVESSIQALNEAAARLRAWLG